MTSVIDPNSHTITYSYDGDNRETGETWVNPGGGSALNLVTITYDADGDITQIKDANTNYQYTYNADDEVSTFADNGTTGLPLVTLTYGYDGDSNETSVTDSQGGVVSYTYDARDELTNETFSGTGLSAEAVTYAYDNAGRLTGLTRYSNLAETTEVAATAYSYDHADRMTGIVDSNSTGTTLVSYGYTYDAADRVSQETRTWASGASSDTLTYIVHEQQPVDRRDAHERLVLERELHVGQQRQRNRHGLSRRAPTTSRRLRPATRTPTTTPAK